MKIFIPISYDQAEAVSSKLQRMKDDLFSVSENINVKSSKVGKYSNDNSDTAVSISLVTGKIIISNFTVNYRSIHTVVLLFFF